MSMSTVVQSHSFVPSTGFQRTQLQRRPTDAIHNINTSAGSSRPVIPLSTRPRGHSFTTHKYRGSGSNVELGVLREEHSGAGTSKTQSRGVSAAPKSRVNPSPFALPLEDNYVFVSTTSHSSEDVPALARESSEKSKYLSFRIPSFQSQTTESSSDNSTTPTPTLTPTQASHRLKDPDIPIATAKMEQGQPSTANKYATFSGSRFSSLSRRRGKLSDIYPDPPNASVVSSQRQLASPPVRLPGASLPHVSTSGNNSSPGRRRSSSQPPLPGTISSSTGSSHIRQSLNPSSLSTVSTLSQHSSSSHRSSFPLAPHSSPPQFTILRPYRLMNLLRTTMTSKSGGHITRRLHVPNEVWFQTGVKLSNLPEKIRVVDSLCIGLEEIQIASPKIISSRDNNNNDSNNVLPALVSTAADHGTKDMERWLHKLDDWNAACDGILLNFGRKLGVREGFVAKKNGADKVPFWVRPTNVDSMAIYVSGLVKLFYLAQTLGEHTNALFLAQIPPPYDSVSLELRQALELRLKRSSDFFSSVVLAFVTRDLYLLLDKYMKSKVEKWLAE